MLPQYVARLNRPYAGSHYVTFRGSELTPHRHISRGRFCI